MQPLGEIAMSDIESIINNAYENRANLSPTRIEVQTKEAIFHVIELLDKGELRVAEKKQGHWITHQWVKKAVLLYFRIHDNQLFENGYTQYFDKIPMKYVDMSTASLNQTGVRIVPGACVRKGCYISPNTILMPSFVNIGAYIDNGVMVDTWATVGSCAQIGKNVHLSGGVGIGGVLEPLQANPTIIEDNCFIGARSEIVEGVIVEEGAVISMGVFIGQSTRIYNRMTKEVSFGRIPAGSVVVPGNLPAEDGTHSLYCAVIVKHVDEKTRDKVSLNEILRNLEKESIEK